MAGKRKAKPRRKTRAGHGLDFAESSQLNDRQQLFVRHYLATMNGTRAAREAGYSEKSAAQMASALLRNPKIRDAVDAGLRERAMGADETVARISDSARFDPSEFTDDDGRIDIAKARELGALRHVRKITERSRLTEEGRETTVVYEFHDSQAALFKMGDRHRLFAQRHEHTGKDGGPIAVTSWAGLLAGLDENGGHAGHNGNGYHGNGLADASAGRGPGGAGTA